MFWPVQVLGAVRVVDALLGSPSGRGATPFVSNEIFIRWRPAIYKWSIITVEVLFAVEHCKHLCRIACSLCNKHNRDWDIRQRSSTSYWAEIIILFWLEQPQYRFPPSEILTRCKVLCYSRPWKRSFFYRRLHLYDRWHLHLCRLNRFMCLFTCRLRPYSGHHGSLSAQVQHRLFLFTGLAAFWPVNVRLTRNTASMFVIIRKSIIVLQLHRILWRLDKIAHLISANAIHTAVLFLRSVMKSRSHSLRFLHLGVFLPHILGIIINLFTLLGLFYLMYFWL